jgi:hypothetical protein
MKSEKDNVLRKFTFGKLLLEKIEAGDFTIDWNGHWQNGTEMGNRWKEFLSAAYFSHIPNKVFHAVEKGQRLKQPVNLGEMPLFSECGNCGLAAEFICNGKKLKIKHPCPNPNGLYPMEAELNVPSGKIVFANDLRNIFRIIGNFNVNQNIGILSTVRAYEEVGMMHFFVGNTMPGIWKADNERLTISYGPKDKFYDEDKKALVSYDEKVVQLTTPEGTEVGDICTDLWWYCAVDHDELSNRLGNNRLFKQLIKSDGVTIVDVKPGVYHFSHTYQSWEKYEKTIDQPTHWTIIRRVRKPDKVRDFQSNFSSINLTAGQVLWDSIKNYPRLYLPKNKKWNQLTADERMEAVQRAADHVLVTNGTGVEWHPNGWGADHPDIPMDAPEVEIPVFNKKFRWYDLSPTFSPICCAVGMFCKNYKKPQYYLNESFRALAFNILHCIVRYGIDDERFGREQEAEFTKKTLKTAREALKRFAKIYPKSIPDYCKDLIS